MPRPAEIKLMAVPGRVPARSARRSLPGQDRRIAAVVLPWTAAARTQSDHDRHAEPPWTSLTRKRSLVQIQYGPRSLTWPFLFLTLPSSALRPYNWPYCQGGRMPRPQTAGTRPGRRRGRARTPTAQN